MTLPSSFLPFIFLVLDDGCTCSPVSFYNDNNFVKCLIYIYIYTFYQTLTHPQAYALKRLKDRYLYYT